MRLENAAIQTWVDEIRRMTTPEQVVFCDGSQGEKDRLVRECLATGELIEQFTRSTAADVDRAVQTARAAWEDWRLVPAPERGMITGAGDHHRH